MFKNGLQEEATESQFQFSISISITASLAFVFCFIVVIVCFCFFFLSLNNEPRLEILFVEEVAKVKGSRFSLPEKEKRCG